MIRTLDDTFFDVKVDFCGGGKPENLESNAWSQIEMKQPMYKSRIEVREVTVMGGADVDHFTNLPPLQQQL